MASTGNTAHREPWNKGKIVGQKAPFKLKDIWALRVLLPLTGRTPTIGKSSLSEPSTFSQKCRVGLHKRAACMQMVRCAVGSQSVDAGTTQSQNPPPLQPAQ